VRLLPHLAAVVALALLAAGPPAASAQDPVDPDADPFYAAPKNLKRAKPGAILDSRETVISAQGSQLPNDAWQLLYRTTDSKGKPVAAVTTIVLPIAPAPVDGRLPLVSYQTAEDSLGTQCAPSYTLRTGTEREAPLIQQALGRGWAVVAPDHEGPESQYGAGRMAGHAVLDSIRAAQRFRPAGLGARRTSVGIWGYSGGGLATAWAAELAPGYAPNLEIAGVAGGGVPPDIEAVARQIDGGPFAGILFGAAQGIERAYPGMRVREFLNAEGRALYDRISDMCVTELSREGQFKRVADLSTVPDPLALPRIQRVLARNHLGGATPTAPLYIYHAIVDELIPIADVDELVAEYCAEGVAVQYHRDPASEHVSLVATGALPALAYLADRFAGTPAPSSC
jgi:hypothetical protein